MGSRSRRRTGLLSLCLAISQPAVFAQAAAVTNFVPPPTQQITPTVIQEMPQVPQSRPLLPTQFSLPQVNSTTILPTDAINFSFGAPTHVLNGPSGAATANAFAFDDLNAFLKEHGWDHPVSKEDRQALLSEDGITVDTAFAEDDTKLVPLANSDSQANFLWMTSAGAASSHTIIRFNEACPELSVFTQPYQFMHVGKGTSDDALLSGSPGTCIANNNEDIVLYDGQLIVDAGKTPCRVATKAAGVKIEAESTALITYQPGKTLVVRSLAGKGSGPIKLRLAILPNKVFELPAEQELSVDLSLSAEDAEKSITISKFNETECTGAMPERAAGECTHEFQRMRAHLQAVEAEQSYDTTTHPPHYQANAHGGHEHHHPQTMLLRKPVHVLGTPGSRFVASESGNIGLLSGKVLLHSHTPQVVCTQLGDVYLQSDAVATLERWQGEFRAQCCSKPKSAILVADKCGVPMNWGMEALVTDHRPSLADVAPDDRIGRRNFEMHDLTGKFCVISDFSIPTLLVKSEHLKPVRKAQTTRNKQLRDHLLKTAAAMQVVTAAKGRYYLQSELAAACAQTKTR